jgi:hypothetical protein
MLLMMKFDSTVLIVVGIADWSGEQNGRWGTLKICVALNKERESAEAIENNSFVHIIVIDLFHRK